MSAKPTKDLSPAEARAVWGKTAPVEKVAWTSELALRALRVDPSLTGPRLRRAVRKAMRVRQLSPEGRDALRRAGLYSGG